MNKPVFPRTSFLRIICNVITFPKIQMFFLPFKPYPKFYQILEAAKKTPVPETLFNKLGTTASKTTQWVSLLRAL